MSIVFTPFELVAVTASVLIANRVASDGESNWLEGLQLVTVYLMIGAAFFFVLNYGQKMPYSITVSHQLHLFSVHFFMVLK